MIKQIIENHLIPNDCFIYGFSDLRGLIDKKFNGFEYGISIGRKLDDSVINGIDKGPTIEYYNLYNEVNSDLKKVCEDIHSD